MKIKIKSQHILYIIVLYLGLFLPTSINGQENEVFNFALNSFVLTVILVYLSIMVKFNKKNLFIGTALILYLLLSSTVTLMVIDANFSIARLVPSVLIIVFFTMDLNDFKKVDQRFAEYHLTISTSIICIFGYLMMIGNTTVKVFLTDYYTQFSQLSSQYAISVGKPVTFFGVHNIASFTYLILFILWYIKLKKNNHSKARLFCLQLLFITIFLRSTTSIGFSIIMFYLLISQFLNQLNFGSIIKKLAIVSMFIVLIVLYKDVVIDYIEILLSTSNGFIPRYFSSNSLFAGNFEVLQRAILGIGFTIPSSNYSVYYADSGFIIYYTMGGILFLIGMYYLFYVYIKKNIGSYWIYFLFAVVIFDLGMPSLIYSRFLYLWILSTLFIGSINGTTI